MHTINISSQKRNQIIDITPKVKAIVSETGITADMLVVYSPHTTAAITVNENADPDVK